MSDELFKSLVVIGVFLIPAVVMIATDRLGNHDSEPFWIQILKGLISIMPFAGLFYGLRTLIEIVYGI